MESPPFKIGHDKDRASALPDELLLGILERLDLRDAVRAGAVSTRWRHLPHQLSRLRLDVNDFHATTRLEIMDAFMGATRRLLSDCNCDDGKSRLPVKALHLCFYLSAPHLRPIGRAVEDTVSRGETKRFEFKIITPSSSLIAPRQAASRTKMRKRLILFSRACPVAFRWLTGLSLTSLKFRNSDLPRLIGACGNLKHLSLCSCGLVRHSTVLKIDVPNSAITNLEFIRFKCRRIELVSVPKLMRLTCRGWRSNNPPLRFGHVPELHMVNLACRAKTWHAPFALSKLFPLNTMNLSKLYLSFGCHMIWVQPERSPRLTAIFSNLTDVALWCFFTECDLSWTLFILEAAPALQKFEVNRTRHSCAKTSEDCAAKTNVVWEPSEDLKHQNLQLLVIFGFEDEDKVADYIRLIMERAASLKIVKLQSWKCDLCDAAVLEAQRTSQEDEDRKHRVKKLLTSGTPSSVEITIC